MGDGASSWFDAGDNNIDLRNPVNRYLLKRKHWYRYAFGSKAGRFRNEGMSNLITLTGGQKYKFEMSMFHCVHNEMKEDGLSFASIWWTSKDLET